MFFSLQCLCWYPTYISNQLLQCYYLSMDASFIQCILFRHKPVLVVPFSMSNISCFSDLHTFSHTKKNHQGNSNRNRSPLNLYQVHHDIQNTDGFWRWNAQPYFSHADIDSIIICVLPRWDLAIHTVSRKLDIIDLTDCLLIQSLR